MRRWLPKSARVVLRDDASLHGSVFHCTWPADSEGSNEAMRTQEMTVLLAATAVDAYGAANSRVRGQMLTKFGEIVRRLAGHGRYRDEPSWQKRIVHICDLEP